MWPRSWSLALSTVGADVVLANHNTACEANASVHAVSQHKDPATGIDVTGIRATLEGQTIDPCTGPGNGTITWIWIAIEGPCSECILQVGLGRAQGEVMGYWRAWGRNVDAQGCGNYSHVPPLAYRLSDWSGSSADYEISLGSGTWYYKIDGVNRYTVWDGNICWRNFRADWFGENYNLGSAIGGYNSNHHRVTVNRYRVGGGSTWNSPAWTSTGCDIWADPFKCITVGADQIDMWTEH